MDHLQSEAWAESGHQLSSERHDLAGLQPQGNPFLMELALVVSMADITNQYPCLRVLTKTDSHYQSIQVGLLAALI